MTVKQVVMIYIIAVNVVAFVMYGIDKWKAKHSKWRIPEATLLGLAVLGGSIGAWLGMKVWHHKTMHKKFKYGIPLILIGQVAIVLLATCRTGQMTGLSEPIPQVHWLRQAHSPHVFLQPVKARLATK